MIKKRTTICLTVALAIVLSTAFISPVFAEDSTSGGIKRVGETIKEKIQEQKSKLQETREAKKEEAMQKARRAIEARGQHFKLIIFRAGQLLDKLQIRIDRASVAGKDVTALNTLMVDSRTKLADARVRLDTVQASSSAIKDKTAFEKGRKEFKAIMEDLRVIHKNTSQIIRTLKGFNSATSSGQNPQATSSTNPAKLNR